MTQSGVKTKLCHIVKRANFDGYGFNLHSEKAKPGQFIGKVDANSPAEMAGLKEGDRIIEVNGQSIEGITHKQVVQRIKAIEKEVHLLLIDGMHLDDKTQMDSNGKVLATNDNINNRNSHHDDNHDGDDDNDGDDNGDDDGDSGGGINQVLPGVSENINSITMVSTKRPYQDSQHHNINGHNGSDQVDYINRNNNHNNSNSNSNNNMKNAINDAIDNDNDNDHDAVEMMMMMPTTKNIPPPPSAITANNNHHSKVIAMATTAATSATTTVPTTNGNALSKSNATETSTITTAITKATATATAAVAVATATTSNANDMSSAMMQQPATMHKAGSLQLPLTAAEMRAKLMAKKKYDPKNESVDLRKKYEIVQKL